MGHYCPAVGTRKRKVKRLWMDSFCVCISGDRPGKGWRGISQALAGRAEKAWQALLEENRSVCMAGLRRQGRLLENWSRGVWDCCVLISS